MVKIKGRPANNPILILHAKDGRTDSQKPLAIGAGHFKAALAIAQAFRNQGENNILVEDALFFMTPLYSALYSSIYSYLSSKKPHLFKSIYGLSDQTTPSFRNLIFRFWLYLERGMGHRLEKYLKKISPSMVICTHFLPLNIMSQLKKKGKLEVPVVGVVTDIHPHRVWIYPEIDLYCVADVESLHELEKHWKQNK